MAKKMQKTIRKKSTTAQRMKSAEQGAKELAQAFARKSNAFNVELFENYVKDLQSGALPTPTAGRLYLPDPVQTGLRIYIYKSGSISYHAKYKVDGSDAQPLLKIGEHPDMSLDDARYVTRTIQSLGRRGIDVQAGLHARLVRELLAKGEGWRPN